LRFKTPVGVQWFFEKWLAMRMKRYAAVLVPDFEEPNLTGILSHNLRYLPKDRIKYIGMLSHLRKLDLPQDIDYLISLSGPEPQRTILEKRVLAQVGQLKGKVIIAGGKPGGKDENLGPNVQHFAFLNAQQQQDAMNRAKFIVTRSGYTTMMELVELEKTQVLLLPTPGQTEQEYLGDYCEKRRYYRHMSQFRLQLVRDARTQKSFTGFPAPWKTAESVARAMEIIRL
jgi:UDP-N-acetylglucosamine transferase subunit ALG13